MKRRWLATQVFMSCLVSIGFLSGCGSTKLATQTPATTSAVNNASYTPISNPNPPFTNKLNQEVGVPDPQFDPIAADPSVYQHISVYAENGTPTLLNASQYPVLFEAYWCPHCQRTLVMLNKNRDKIHRFPILVSMGFAKGTTLSQAIAITHQELTEYHLQNVKVYYSLDPNTSHFVPQGFPTMVFSDQKKLAMLIGEHTFPNWMQALNLS